MYEEIVENFPIYFIAFMGLCLVICLASGIIYYSVKKKDANKELVSRRGQILEKVSQQGNFALYVVEFENKERVRLKCFRANELLISIGDVGIIKYRGETIEDFQR